MTAIAAAYAKCGFVIAADGKLACEDPDASNAARQEQRLDAHKIFEISGEGRSMAYAFLGTVLNKTAGYDLVSECRKQVSMLSGAPIQSGVGYVCTLSDALKSYIDMARQHYPGSVGKKPITMLLVGYFNGEACWFEVTFTEWTSDPAICPREPLHYGACFARGSDIIKKAMYKEHDPRFSRYTKVPTDGMSLTDGEDFAKGYIEACKTPLARQLDRDCEHIGGNVHVAQVTRLGFRWVIPPKGGRRFTRARR
jgi:hypothetical protein